VRERNISHVVLHGEVLVSEAEALNTHTCGVALGDVE
jgi:hypothetical protein